MCGKDTEIGFQIMLYKFRKQTLHIQHKLTDKYGLKTALSWGISSITQIIDLLP